MANARPDRAYHECLPGAQFIHTLKSLRSLTQRCQLSQFVKDPSLVSLFITQEQATPDDVLDEEGSSPITVKPSGAIDGLLEMGIFPGRHYQLRYLQKNDHVLLFLEF